mmetsp:Transcript_17943/g.23477  ORF Transcript_17943/g.23477 Transcript_17943/m.23477 type:complete len:787 (-) Transcript_17943:2917-5277(-)
MFQELEELPEQTEELEAQEDSDDTKNQVAEAAAVPYSSAARDVISGAASPSLAKYSASERIKTASEFWKKFDLDGQRFKLDEKGLEVANNQEKSVRSRKKLAEATKEFRKTGNAEARIRKVGPLLRQYQEEIDRLTRRARFAEGSFLSLYKSLYEAPDPVPLLFDAEADKRKASELEFRVERLQTEMVEYEEEFSTLKNQDITIRKLEDQLATAEKNVESRVLEALAEKESEMNAAVESVNLELQYKNSQMHEELEDALAQVAEVQRMYDNAQEQLFELRTSMEDRDAAHQSEYDILAEDAARSRSLNESLQTELENLRKKMQELPNKSNETGDKSLSERIIVLEDELFAKNEKLQVLETQAKNTKAEFELMAGKLEDEKESLKRLFKKEQDEVAALKNKIESGPTQATVNELERQLRIFQKLEYNVSNDEEDEPEYSSLKGNSNGKILIAKVRKLEEEKTRVKNGLAKLENDLTKVKSEKQNVEDENEDLKKLVQKLENELQHKTLNRHSSSQSGEFVDASSAKGRKSNNHLEREESSGQTQSSILLNALRMPNEGTSLSGLEPVNDYQGLESDSSSMLNIVHEQRNRFRRRMLELETEKDSLAAKAIKYSSQIQTLKSDNVKLYEKIKYLETCYRPGASPSLTGLNQNQMSEVRLNVRKSPGHSNGSEVEMKYKSMYEDQMNPFANFSLRERRKRVRGLNTVERLTFKATDFFLSNKYTRMFLFFYFVSLHLLVSFMLLFSTHTTYTKCTHSTSHMYPGSDFIPQNVLEHALGEQAVDQPPPAK